MRVMVLVKASEESEAGRLPSREELERMADFNEELAKAGLMLAGEGLHPSSRGARIAFEGSEREVIEGPFAPPAELVAGFWIWRVGSLDEAIEWAKRIPFEDGAVELRPVFEPDDFGDELTPELRAREAELRASGEALQGREGASS